MPWLEHAGKRVLFVHIPRTGGTTVERWLQESAPLRFRSVGLPAFSRITPQHYTVNDIRALLGDGFFDYSFAIVRNPLTRIASEYRLRARLGRQDSFWREASTFSLWLEKQAAALAANPFHLDNHMRPQWQFLADDVKVFRFEEGLPAIIAQVAADIGIPFDSSSVAHQLATSEADGEVKWDIRERGLITDMYRRDFEMFGYDVPV
jgi:hypothetical protein